MSIAVTNPTKESFASKVRWAIIDSKTITTRNLIRYLRIPDAIFFSSVQPVMFVLLFRYVFGGAIRVPGVSYVNFLIAGVFVQSVAFGSIATAVGLADDLHTGLIERFRALPMARSAVLAGRTIADVARNVWVLAILTGVGYAVGFRIETTVGRFLLGILIVLGFAYAISWGFAIIGLSASNAEAAQLAAFPLLFPLTFASSAFVPVSSMPGWLQAFAVHQPVSQIADATRYLMIGGHSNLWGSSNVWQALAWIAGLFLVLAPLAVRKFRKIS
jgi:ABC-2 type transport system permease protein/oleandomycin transport system permease protein